MVDENFVKITFIGLLPCFNAFVWLSLISNGWIAMYSMHIICMIIIPTLFFGFNFLKNLFQVFLDIRKHFNLTKCTYFLLIVVSLIFLFIGLIYKLPNLNLIFRLLDTERIKKGLIIQGIVNNKEFNLYTKVCCIYFCFINPIMEELFWRSFIFNELLRLRDRNEFNNDLNTILMDNSEEILEKYEIETGLINCDSKPKEFESFICSVLYSLYHFFVLIHFSSYIITIICTFTLVIIGEILVLISVRYHILYSIYTHIGLDVLFILFLWVIVEI